MYLIMRHLVTYEIFENSNSSAWKGHIECLRDICLDITDSDFYVVIDELKRSGVCNPESIRVSMCIKYKSFTYDDVKDVFERMVEYMESEGFEILSIFYSTPDDPASHYSMKYINGSLITLGGNPRLASFGKEINSFNHIEVRFTNWF